MTSSRILSAAGTPPGSRSSSISSPRALSASSSPAASVVLPAPSMPSIVISRPRFIARARDPTGHYDRGMLAELERHPHARAVLGPALAGSGRASHAYLFYGPGGAGKRAAARAVAAELLSDGSPDPAGARARVASGAHPDLTWV